MKNRLYKSGCGLLVAVCGVLVPLGVAQADSYADRMHEEKTGAWGERQSYLPNDAIPTAQQLLSAPASKGPQGPIRSESMKEEHHGMQQKWEDTDKGSSKRYDPDLTRHLMYGGS